MSSFDNPYAAPQPAQQFPQPSGYGATSTGHLGVGIQRDGVLLVIDRRSHQFAPICAKSGVPTHNTYKIEQVFLDDATRMTAFAVGGLIGAGLARLFYGDKVVVVLPVEPACAVKTPKSMVLPAVIFGIGLVALVIGGAIGLTLDREALMAILLISGLITLIGLLIGVENYFNPIPPFKIVRTSKTHIWIEGAHPQYLAQLPGMMPTNLIPQR